MFIGKFTLKSNKCVYRSCTKTLNKKPRQKKAKKAKKAKKTKGANLWMKKSQK